MRNEQPWYETVSIPALLRHARFTYSAAMREALDAAGYSDIPKNGLYVIGGLALGAPDAAERDHRRPQPFQADPQDNWSIRLSRADIWNAAPIPAIAAG
ncbi:MAG: hypothetical protein R3C60_15355 [Parvularculaceae bacterium]